MKPFDLEAAKRGEPVCTRDGRKARIICFDRKTEYGQQILVLAELHNKYEDIYCAEKNGRFFHSDCEHVYDLFMAPKTKKLFIAISIQPTEDGSHGITRGYISENELQDFRNDREWIIKLIEIEV